MRRVRIERAVAPGATLARDVVGGGGEVVARAGHELTARSVQALLERGVAWCFVDDALGAGIDGAPLDGEVSAVRAVLVSLHARILDAVNPLLRLPASRVLHVLRETQPIAHLAHAAAFLVLRDAAAELARRARAVDANAGYVVAHQATGDEIGHALGVAALAARIGAIAGLDEPTIVDVAQAALLHDAGMVFVPAVVRDAPPVGWQTPHRRRYEDHAVLGAALLAPLGSPGLDLSMVAAEHHEAQDGSGYPRGIRGGNRVLRTAEAKRDLDRLALVSEIVAVADAYERLLSPAPGYAGCSAAAARVALEAQSGTRLNRELVTRFLASFPALPVGTDVRVATGRHAGARGLVRSASTQPGAPHIVRLTSDTEGHAIAPMDVDLAREPGAALALLEEAA